MENEKKFPGQNPGEKVFLFVRHHWLNFISSIVIVILLALVPFILFPLINHSPWLVNVEDFRSFYILGTSAYLLFLCLFLMVTWIDYYFDILIITNERLVHIEQNGLFSRQTSELNLLRVQNVSTEIQGLLHTMFNYGDLIVETAGGLAQEEDQKYRVHTHAHATSDFTIEDIPNPDKLSQTVLHLHEQLVEELRQSGGNAEGEGDIHPLNYPPENPKPPAGQSAEEPTSPPEPQNHTASQPEDNPAPKASENPPPANEPSDQNEGELKEGETVDLWHDK